MSIYSKLSYIRIRHCKKGASFPREYLRLIKLSGLTIRQLADLLNMNYIRLKSIIYSDKIAMDNKEYKLIAGFCDNIKELEEKGYFT